MKAYFLFTSGGPLVILTSYKSIEHPDLLKRLKAKGIGKFVAFEVSIESVKSKYGDHFDVVKEDLHQTDDLRVLDYNGERAFKKFKFNEFITPIYHEVAE